MGNWDQALLWGIDGVDADSDEWRPILDEWESMFSVEIDAARDELRRKRGHYYAMFACECEHRFVPQPDDEMSAIGFWVAIENGWGDEVPTMDVRVAIDAIESTEPYASSLRRARAKWQVFSEWLAGKGIVVPEARLWMTVTPSVEDHRRVRRVAVSKE